MNYVRVSPQLRTALCSETFLLFGIDETFSTARASGHSEEMEKKKERKKTAAPEVTHTNGNSSE